MKHNIIFLNYGHSRLDNPVFRIFMQETPGKRLVSLSFPAKTPEDRELVHDVNELRRKETELSDVAFHLCIDLERAGEAAALEQSVRQIHRLFPAGKEHQYPCFVYALFSHLDELDDNTRHNVWDNLAQLNNVVASYSEFKFVEQIYLYHDISMQSLATFLHDVIQAEIAPSQLQTREGSMVDTREEWPAIFGTFHAAGITYPEQEVRRFLQLKYVQHLLRYSLPDLNPTPMETCNSVAQRVLANVPIQPNRITLQEEMFLNIDEQSSQWKTVDEYWRETADMQSQALGDIPREEWLSKIRQRMDVQFQSRFRSMGVDYFFQIQSKKTDAYSSVMQAIISQSLDKILLSNSYTPDAQKNIVNAIINALQQRVIEIQNLSNDTQRTIKELENEALSIKTRWEGMNFFSRMMGKDAGLLTGFTDCMMRLYTQKTILPGCNFAIKLLNELIPSIQGMAERFDESRKICDLAIRAIQMNVADADPSEALGKFSKLQLEQVCNQIEADTETFKAQYAKVVPILLSKPSAIDGDDMIARIESQFADEIDAYLDLATQTGKIAPVINQAITDRMAKLYADKGGLSAFIDVLKDHTRLDLELKEAKCSDKYLLITPTLTEASDIDHVLTSNASHILLLHLQQGLRLTDLDGFSGHKMFIEPSLF